MSRLTQKLESGIRTEAYISLAVVGVWVILLLIALSRAAYLVFGPQTGENGNGGNGPNFHSNASLTTVSDGMGVEMMEKSQQPQSQPPSYRGVPMGASPLEAEKYGAGSSVGSTGSTGFQPGPPPMSPTRARFAGPVAMPMPMPMPTYTQYPPEHTNASSSPFAANGDLCMAQDRGNTYRGVPYTLTPQPMPSMPAAERESLGYAGKRSVDLQKPKVVRVSSYGNLE